MAHEPRRERGGRDREERDSEFTDKLVHINRVAKVVKGGKRFGFAALVVVGDQKGRIGFGHGKAREVPEAIRKATEEAKKSMIRVPLREGRTLHHDVFGRHGAGKVFLRAAPPGTGIIAGGPMRAVFESLGMQDVVAKSIGSSNPYNMVRIPLKDGRTLHHETHGRHGAGKVIVRPAVQGTGIIAGGPMRAVFETLGMQDVVAKSLGSSNPYNMVRATFDALKRQDSPRSVAARRSIKVSTLQSRRREGGDEAVTE